jgi:hypothetical protein
MACAAVARLRRLVKKAGRSFSVMPGNELAFPENLIDCDGRDREKWGGR